MQSDLVSAAEFEVLRLEQDSTCRRFYRSFLDDVTELYQYSAL